MDATRVMSHVAMSAPCLSMLLSSHCSTIYHIYYGFTSKVQTKVHIRKTLRMWTIWWVWYVWQLWQISLSEIFFFHFLITNFKASESCQYPMCVTPSQNFQFLTELFKNTNLVIWLLLFCGPSQPVAGRFNHPWHWIAIICMGLTKLELSHYPSQSLQVLSQHRLTWDISSNGQRFLVGHCNLVYWCSDLQ